MNRDAGKWVLITCIVLFVWNWLISALLLYLATHHFHEVSPLLYLSSWINLPASTHHILLNAGAISALIIVVVGLLVLKPGIPDIYGKARFATLLDIKKAGLLAKEGVVLGRAFSKSLRLSGYEHVTVFAPTGTGKTTGITVPNLLDWHESCVVSDIKLQLLN